MPSPRAGLAIRLTAYGIAALIGVCAVAWAMTPATILGAGGVFRFPPGDLSQNLTGHLAFQDPGWHWPPLRAPALAWPAGESIAMTDSNPILSIVAKLLAGLVGHRVNLMGIWFALCIILQPFGAVFVLRGFRRPAGDDRRGPIAAAAASALALLLPAFLFRIIHINLFAHFLLLAALGVALRYCVSETVPGFAAAMGLLLGVVFVHPYLFVFASVILAAPALHLLIRGKEGARAGLRVWALATLLSIGAFLGLSESLSTGGPGFGRYSMNLAGPFWPQFSGLFGADLPILDATGFQREGFNYLGAGNLLLLFAVAVLMVRAGQPARRAVLTRFAGLTVCLAALTALAVTPRVTFLHAVLLPLDIPILDRLLASVRASGRAIWVVDYACVVGAIAYLSARLRPRVLAPVLACAVALQWIDTAPPRNTARGFLAGAGQEAPAFTMPPGTALFSVVPWCAEDEFGADADRLAGFRAGARLKEVRLAHPPVPDACAAALRAGLDTALAPGETRLFLASAKLNVRRDRLGVHTVCDDTQTGLLCHTSPAPH